MVFLLYLLKHGDRLPKYNLQELGIVKNKMTFYNYENNCFDLMVLT